MKRKLLSIILCLAMALSLLPTAALAEEEGGAAANDGTEARPYTLAELGAMKRDAYIEAQTRLGGTMYVTVGKYSHGTNGVLGNGVRDDTTGQTENRNVLNGYNSNGYLGAGNDGANGKNVVFVNGSITSGTTGYTSIDNIGTSLLLAVPAYTNVTFQNITFNNVMSFDYQLYTGPWSQLGELKFEGCTFNGIIVGAIAAQKLTFNGCTFTNYTNTTSANNSNPTWIRPAYGNWTKGDNEGQGEDFKSLTTINFTGNTVTSTRPVKFERISQWDITSTVTATGNSFDIKAQTGDTSTKNVGLYFGANAKFDLVAENNTRSANTAALYTIPEGKTSLPAGSTVKDSSGNEIELTDALKWKGNPNNPDDVLTLKTAYTEGAVAGINGVSYYSLTEAIAAVKDGETITILAAGEYTLNGSLAYTGKAFTIEAAEGVNVAFDMSAAVALHGAKITFKGVTFNYKTNGNYIGIQHADTLVYNNCTINGQVFLYAASETFNGCTFNQTSADAYNVWTYGAKNVVFNHCTFNCVGKSVLVYNEGAVSSTDLTVTDTEFKASAPVAGKAAIEIDTSLMSGGATITIDAVTESKVSGFGTGSISGNSLWNDKKQTEDTNSNTTVTVAGETVFAPRVATVGGVTYSSLEAAFAALTTTNHTLTLTSVGEAKWSDTTPVYWKAGTQSGYAATLKAALTAAQTGTDSVLIVCRPGATVTASNDGVHYDVTNNLTIYANNADFSGKDLSIGTYAAPKNSETTINIYDAKNLVVWGQPVGDRADVWNVNFVDCENNGHNFLMYRGSETGKATLNATLTGCKATGFSDSIIHTTADGSIKITNCTFADNCAPVNIAHKQSGSMVVEIEGCTFTNCGKVDESNNYFAPVRMVNNNAQGTLSVSVKNTAFAGTIGENGDILLGDGRNGKESYDVSATVTGTAAKIVAQRPGHYNGSALDQTKQESKTLTANDTLSTTLNEMLPLKGTVTFDEFLAMVEAYGYNFDGTAVTGDGSKLVVKWSPVNGCFDTRAGHNCTVNNVAATGNTPKKVRGNDAQFYLMEGMTEALSIKNVSFEFEPKAFTVCDNSQEAGTWSANKNDEKNVQNGQLYVMTSGNVTVENCEFDKVVLTMFNTTGTSTVKNCNFANVYNSYAIKDIRGENISVTGTTIENCGGGIMASQTANDTTVKSVDISDNVFKNVDVADTAAEGKVGTRAILQIASSGNYTDADFTLDGNTATNCGPILRQLNESFDNSNAITKVKGDLTGLLDENGKLTYTGDSLPKTTEENPNPEKPQPTIYTVKFSGSDVADMKVASGTEITLPTATKYGYTFKGWKLGTETKNANDKVTISSDTTFTAVWQSNSSSSGSSGSSTSAITTPSKTENGTVTVSPRYASKGDTVTVTVKPDSGYVLETLTVTDKNGNELTLKDKGNGKYTFTMPAGKVEVKATFMEDNSMLNFFYDVPNNAYFYEAVKWAVENGITTGVGNDLFAPEQPCTRAQIVTFLWRAAGSPEPKGAASGMTDVVSGSYYEKAVAWAIENGITTGTTTSTFSPDATCTRAQAVTFLARALKAKAASAAEFSDVPTDSYFADAVAWAAANGVTEGIGGGLFGSDNDCTRGQIVTFLYRAYNK